MNALSHIMHIKKSIKDVHGDTMEAGLNYMTQFPLRGPGNIPTVSTFNENTNPELDHKVKKVTDRFSENIYSVANEPSLAFYRIQEHVHKSLPQLVDKKHEVMDLKEQVRGATHDTEYAIEAVQSMVKSAPHFANIQELLKNAMFMKQQINYEESRRKQERSRPSMYRTRTVDVPSTASNRHSLHESQLQGSMQVIAPVPIAGSPRGRSSSLSESPRQKKT